MAFSIDYGVGPFGWLIVAVLVATGVIVLTFFLKAAKDAHDQVIEEEHDRGNDDVPLA